MSSQALSYRGRFAPSPTGHLHFGSLLAATASYLQARKYNGEWWLRIEDIDPPREISGASSHIIQTLKTYQFEWDNLSYQSQRNDIYAYYIKELLDKNRAYYCGCSRTEVSQYQARHKLKSSVYPGICRNGLNGKQPRSIRLKVGKNPIIVDDAIQGKQSRYLAERSGDFVIKRADGFYAYQLAVAIDDSEQKMSQVVRGFDLHESSFSQRYLCNVLALNSPDYAHIPVVTNQSGLKLSKQSAAPDIANETPQDVLWHALNCLQQSPPKALRSRSLTELWQWAKLHWDLKKIPKIERFAVST